jgi:flavin-binding protein dodecin
MLGSLVKDKEEKEVHLETHVTPVVKVIEVIATSETSFDDAIGRGVKTAARSLRHITGADVKHMTLAVKDGKVTEYRVDLKIAFALDEDDDKDDD